MRRLLYLLLLTTPALAQHRPAPAPKPLAYYCASDWRIKYHRTPSCPGLELCSATVKPLALGVARKSWSRAGFATNTYSSYYSRPTYHTTLH